MPPFKIPLGPLGSRLENSNVEAGRPIRGPAIPPALFCLEPGRNVHSDIWPLVRSCGTSLRVKRPCKGRPEPPREWLADWSTAVDRRNCGYKLRIVISVSLAMDLGKRLIEWRLEITGFRPG